MIHKATEDNYPRLIEIWESSVKATHDFLKPEDFLDIRSKLPRYFDHVDLYIYENPENRVKGFVGVSDSKIEMLFIDNEFRGEGVGKSLIHFAMEELNADRLDVNEQNQQAVGFYKHLGFQIDKRSDTDSEGKNYPILHMIKS